MSERTGQVQLFSDDQVDLPLLRKRAHNLRWATCGEGVIPLTAADPDFKIAVEIREAIARYARDGVMAYGPAEGLLEFREAMVQRLFERDTLRISPDRIMATDGAASAMHVVTRFALSEGDEVIAFDPVDFLFQRSIEAAKGRVVRVPVDAVSAMTKEQLLGAISSRTRMIALCNPVNPTGRVLTPFELSMIGRVAVERNLWVLSDEIWSDIVYPPASHHSIAAVDAEVESRTFIVHGFSKNFGLAGLRVGFLVAPNASIADALLESSGARATVFGAATLSQVAAVAAVQKAHGWLAAFREHLREMRDLAVERLNGFPGVRCHVPQGTYVAFPNIEGLGLSAEATAERFLTAARVAVVPGSTRWFGPGAAGHVRLCFATSRGILSEALDRLASAVVSMRPR